MGWCRKGWDSLGSGKSWWAGAGRGWNSLGVVHAGGLVQAKGGIAWDWDKLVQAEGGIVW